ncbi:MAG: hypothetical protein K2P93_00465 [Alphaproteobacteria bacterium]|nr:hypothetical protein [Alphaproteobacteria bacterium]
MNKYYIKESDWEKLYTFLKTIAGIRIGNERKTRAFAEGVYFIMRTGPNDVNFQDIMANGEVSINALNQWSHNGL